MRFFDPLDYLGCVPKAWKQYCPIDGEEWPDRLESWKLGWMHRKKHGPGTRTVELPTLITDTPSLYASWLQGYSAADNFFQRGELDD